MGLRVGLCVLVGSSSSKRVLKSDEYLATFARKNVELVVDPIEAVTATGMRARGAEDPLDVSSCDPLALTPSVTIV